MGALRGGTGQPGLEPLRRGSGRRRKSGPTRAEPQGASDARAGGLHRRVCTTLKERRGSTSGPKGTPDCVDGLGRGAGSGELRTRLEAKTRVFYRAFLV